MILTPFNNKRNYQGATYTVAPNDSLHKGQADYVCDGVSDEVEIQAAIDAAHANGLGDVFILDGTVNVSAPIFLYYNVKLHGIAAQLTNIQATVPFTGDYMVFIDQSATDPGLRGAEISNLSIFGGNHNILALGNDNLGFLQMNPSSGLSHPELTDLRLFGLNIQWFSGAKNIDIYNPWGFRMRECVTEHILGDGIWLNPGKDTAENRSAQVVSCNFRTNGGNSIVLNGVNEISVLNCELSCGYFDDSKYAIKLINSDTNRIECNIFDANATYRGSGVYADPTSDLNIIDGNTFNAINATTILSGVYIDAGATYNIVNNNIFEGYVTQIVDNGIKTQILGNSSNDSQITRISKFSDTVDLTNMLAKTTPVDADYIPVMDSTASGYLKKTTWENINNTIRSTGDTSASVTSITRSGSVATVTITDHGLYSNQTVTIAGANQTEYNITAKISNVTTHTFDYTVSGTPATPATGTITATTNVIDITNSSGSMKSTSIFPAILANINAYLFGLNYEPSTGLYLSSTGKIELHYQGAVVGSWSMLTGNLATTGYISGTNDQLTKTFVINNPVAAASSIPIWKTPYAITITNINVLCVGGTNWVGGLDELDANGANAIVIDADITATSGTNATDDGALSNPTLNAGDYLGIHTTSVSGSPTYVAITVTYKRT